jgi:hypothetical protein
MTEDGDTGRIGSDGDSGRIGSEGAGRVPYTEPVLRELGALRELTFKSGETKATAIDKPPEKSTKGN